MYLAAKRLTSAEQVVQAVQVGMAAMEALRGYCTGRGPSGGQGRQGMPGPPGANSKPGKDGQIIVSKLGSPDLGTSNGSRRPPLSADHHCSWWFRLPRTKDREESPGAELFRPPAPPSGIGPNFRETSSGCSDQIADIPVTILRGHVVSKAHRSGQHSRSHAGEKNICKCGIVFVEMVSALGLERFES